MDLTRPRSDAGVDGVGGYYRLREDLPPATIRLIDLLVDGGQVESAFAGQLTAPDDRAG